MVRKGRRNKRKRKWGKIGAPSSKKRKSFLKRIRGK